MQHLRVRKINMNDNQCWKCLEEIVADSDRVRNQDPKVITTVRFCNNPKCNLLNVSVVANQYGDLLNLLFRLSNSWNNGTAYREMPKQLQYAYKEACQTFVNNTYLATAAMCRVLISRLAMAQGAPDGRFNAHIEYLINHNLVITTTENPLNEVRKLGNRANHALDEIARNDALLALVRMDSTLKQIYCKQGIIDTDKNTEYWFMQLIGKALERVCADSVRANVLCTFHDGNLNLRSVEFGCWMS